KSDTEPRGTRFQSTISTPPSFTEIGYRAARDPVSVNDIHATLLHCLGLDHERLTYFHNGREYRLTDVAGKVIEPILV
ncbi:MAG: DUF1501 domain-containing protein, partial [Candidatus Omnitrophica bacterium]|nr:DUF1501 domain-containing protein [Candidatus Omnitrophota bacterium]